jgi:hypothetical protein
VRCRRRPPAAAANAPTRQSGCNAQMLIEPLSNIQSGAQRCGNADVLGQIA